LPKGLQTQGNGVLIVPASQFARLADSNLSRKGSSTVDNLSKFSNYSTGGTTQTSNIMKKLDNLRTQAKTATVIDRKLISLLSNPELLVIAYNNIKSKPGNMTPEIVTETLDGMSSEWFIKTAEQTQSGQFNFQPSRRIAIPKASGGTKPLSIGSPRDKIVQEALRLILEAIFEPTFSDHSHGFRPARSCHTALKEFYTNFRSSQWLIEGDISKCFDSIEHRKLMNLIESRITDRRFTQYINKALNAGYFEFRVYEHNIAGTPQGSIISPLLANIFLHQLDAFVDSLKLEFDKGVKPRRNPIARRYEWKIAKAKKLGDLILVRDLAIEAKKYSFVDFNDTEYRRLMYTRYADDWIIGIRGTHSDALMILDKVSEFCSNIGLKVSPDKTKITNLRTSKGLFLGVELSRSNHTKFSRVVISSSTKRLPLNLRLTAPIPRIIKKLTDTGFIDNGKPAPRFLWLHNSHDQIIHLYNAVFRGYLNYYSFVHNYSRLLSLLNHTLKQSAAKLLAAKFKLGTRAKVFEKYGNLLTSPNKISFINPSYKGNHMNFKTGTNKPQTLENIKALSVDSKSLANLLNKVCLVCGSNYKVEMHHVRKMSDLNPKVSHIDKLMVKAKKKQVPLCRKCHMKKHNSN